MEEDKSLEGIIVGLGRSYREVSILIKDKENIIHDEILYCKNDEAQKSYLSVLKTHQKVRLFAYSDRGGFYHKIQILEEAK